MDWKFPARAGFPCHKASMIAAVMRDMISGTQVFNACVKRRCVHRLHAQLHSSMQSQRPGGTW